MFQNGLEISIQRVQVMHGQRTQNERFENFFVIHGWEPEHIAFALYTESDIRTIHRNVGHTSVTGTEELLRKA